jgi:predicted DNA-binding protein (MmcQ/YjbR family)
MPIARRLASAKVALRNHALSYPESYEEFPWEHCAIKVKKKVFLFLFLDEDFLSLSLKLPVSRSEALSLPFAEPTGYGLGKSGWVTCKFYPRDVVPVAMIREWIDESYRAVAPKKLVAMLESGDGGGAPPAAPKRARKPRA